MKAPLESAPAAEVEGEKVEEQRAIRFRGQGDELSFGLRIRLVVDPLQVGGLAAQTGAVVHDLAVDLSRRVIDERHRALFAEERVDVLVGDLRERRMEA